MGKTIFSEDKSCKTKDLPAIWSPGSKSNIRAFQRSASNLKSVLLLLSAVPSFCQLLTSVIRCGFKFPRRFVSQIAGDNSGTSHQVAMFSFGKKKKGPKNEQIPFNDVCGVL